MVNKGRGYFYLAKKHVGLTSQPARHGYIIQKHYEFYFNEQSLIVEYI